MGVIEEVRHHGGDIRMTDLNETVRNIFDILGFQHSIASSHPRWRPVLSFREGGKTAVPARDRFPRPPAPRPEGPQSDEFLGVVRDATRLHGRGGGL